MAGNIKGITVEIGGEVTGLQKALSSVNKDTRSLQAELSGVNRLLKFDPNNVQLLAQKQELLNKTIENTKTKLDALKQAQSEVQKLFESGEIGADEYRKFQRELAATEQSLQKAENAMADMKDQQEQTKKSSQQLSRLFEVTGKSVNDYADILGDKLVRSIQQGTASARDLDRAFNKIAESALGSKDDIDKLKQSLQQLDAGEKSVKKVRKEMQRLSQDAKDAKASIKDMSGAMGGVAAISTGVGAGFAVNKALELDTQDTIIDIAFNVPEESKGAVRDAVNGIKAYGIDASEALEATRRQWALNGDASDAVNQKIIKSAGVITKSFQGIDLTQLIEESSQMGDAMGISQQSAMDMTYALLKIGFPPEEIDIIAEYGSQLHRAGYNAAQIQGILSASVATKSWNIDVLLDGLKEGRIRIAEFGTGVDDTTAKMIEGTGLSTTKLQEWGQAIAGGGVEGQAAMTEVSTALAGIEDATLRNKIGTQLFGTLWEEQGDKITEVLEGATEKTGNLKTNQEELNTAVSTMDTSSQVELNNALTAMNEALMPLYTNIANFVTTIATWVSENQTLAFGIMLVVGAIGLIIGILMILAPIFTLISGVAAAAGVAIGAIVAPIAIAIAIIIAIIAAGMLLIANFDKIMAAAKKLGNWISKTFTEMSNAAKIQMAHVRTNIEVAWNNAIAFLKNIDLVQIGKNAIQGFVDGIAAMGGPISTAVRGLASLVPGGLNKFLKMGSPSKVTEKIGLQTGEGMEIGLKKSLGRIKGMSEEMAKVATPNITINNPIPAGISSGKTVNVNLHSPKALDIREANKQFRHTMNAMSSMW